MCLTHDTHAKLLQHALTHSEPSDFHSKLGQSGDGRTIIIIGTKGRGGDGGGEGGEVGKSRSSSESESCGAWERRGEGEMGVGREERGEVEIVVRVRVMWS
ncbi:hypothetical protein NL676_008945 [Syzygium grande]|nr:hypothetical protein NL676_008945 [Syzygium grande]